MSSISKKRAKLLQNIYYNKQCIRVEGPDDLGSNPAEDTLFNIFSNYSILTDPSLILKHFISILIDE